MKENTNFRVEKWYKKNIFPLLPIINTRPADDHNTKSFSFKWLFFHIWTRDSFDFELAIVADPCHWGFGITMLLPYLRFVATIPVPESISIKIQKYLWRRPKILK